MATVTITLADDPEGGADVVQVTLGFDPILTDEYIASLDRPTPAHHAAERLMKWLTQEYETEIEFKSLPEERTTS